MKKCNTCGTEKSLSSFHKRRASNDGLSSKCKNCQSKYDASRANQPHRVQAREKYAKTPKGIEAGKRAKKKWQEKNIVKRAAHIVTGNAIRDGLLTKKPCEACGLQDPICAHHDDYAKPLEVRWLCPKCHIKWHKENGEGRNA